MALSPELLQSVARELSGLAIQPTDLPTVTALLAAQTDGLARLDGLDLASVEPAVALHPDEEPRA
jgi:hypothetical protein